MAWSLLPDLRKTTYAAGRRDRLRLRFAARGIGWDFHSLAWERRKLIRWHPYIVLSESDFALPSRCARWVSEVHSFDPIRGEAILKVAEGDAPDSAPEVRIKYSWRRWDLTRNRELERLQECVDPFEPLTGNGARAA